MQLMKFSQLDQKLHVSLLESGDEPAKGTPNRYRPASASSGKATKAYMTPLMYAVELRKPNWVKDMIASAASSYSANKKAQGNDRRQAAQGQGQTAKVVNQLMIEWLNVQSGAGNPPTAIFRCAIFLVLSCFGFAVFMMSPVT